MEPGQGSCRRGPPPAGAGAAPSAGGPRLELRSADGGVECVLHAPPTSQAAPRPRAADGSPQAARGAAPEPLATALAHLSHRLSRAAGREVVVRVAGEPLPGDPGFLAALEELGRSAATRLAEDRMAAELAASAWAAELLAPPPALRAQAAAFLATPLDVLRAREGPAAARIVRERFGGRVQLFAPLYLSDACLNDCAYCGFRKSHRRRRVHLSLERALFEARALAARGLRRIDLVSGEVPTDPFVDQVARAVEAILASTGIERVHLNVGALSVAQFRRLRSAGALACHLYQETYDVEVYRRVHRSGPKRDLAWRLEGPERALRAGFEVLGLGVLLGLAEPAAELAALTHHAERLRAAFPGVSLGFSLPRWVPADRECSFHVEHALDDGLFERCLLFVRTRFPDAHLTLTTREGAALRDALLPMGITQLSAGVRTAPGGYGAEPGGTEQFQVGDGRSLEEVAQAVRAAGLIPVA